MKLRPKVKAVIDFVKLLFVAFVIILVLLMALQIKPTGSAEPPEYKIISSIYTDKVEHGVFDALIKGYDLHGDLVTGRDRNGDVVYIQVVTK